MNFILSQLQLNACNGYECYDFSVLKYIKACTVEIQHRQLISLADHSHVTQHSPSGVTGLVQFRGSGGHRSLSHDACVPGSASCGHSQKTQGSMNTFSPLGRVSPILGPKIILQPSSSSSAKEVAIAIMETANTNRDLMVGCSVELDAINSN